LRKLNFNRLSATKFEEFCFELLHELGFINLDWRKGTARKSSPSDSGRDIEAVLERKDIDKTKRQEKWLVDCKHHKRGIPAKELLNLLSWAEAERPDVALFVASGFLSNPAKDYLASYTRNNHPPFKIKYWERPKLEELSKGKLDLLQAFHLVRVWLRPEKEVLRAEDELFDRVWYYRHVIWTEKVRHGLDKVGPEILKIAKAAAKKKRKEYGPGIAGPHSDFDWGFLQGKLSAIRWVLGDDWDFLDT
jgi:restriction endonuclease